MGDLIISYTHYICEVHDVFFLYTHPSHPGKKQEALNSKDHPRKRGVISPVGNHLATAKINDTLRASEIVVTAAAVAALCESIPPNQTENLDSTLSVSVLGTIWFIQSSTPFCSLMHILQ